MDKKIILERKLSQIDDLTGTEQKEMFFDLFGFECGLSNGKNIKKRLFAKLQEIYLGGISESDRLVLRKIAEADDRANLKQTDKSRQIRTLVRPSGQTAFASNQISPASLLAARMYFSLVNSLGLPSVLHRHRN